MSGLISSGRPSLSRDGRPAVTVTIRLPWWQAQELEKEVLALATYRGISIAEARRWVLTSGIRAAAAARNATIDNGPGIPGGGER